MHHNYPLERYVTACANRIHFSNPSSQEDFKVFGNIQSLNNLKKVVGFELTFIKHHDGISKYKIEIRHTNVKYLIQLLPKSVEGLQLFGIPNLNHSEINDDLEVLPRRQQYIRRL
uniref:LAGLIDADG_2 domain-containing protein n=1 Tax=Strongyloides venezuelensis TaxID=75913 RepID=A0A0K0G594_STRVS